MYPPSNIDSLRILFRSNEVGAPVGQSPPTVAVIPGLRICSIVYCDNIDRDVEGTWFHLHSLWRDSNGTPRWTDLTQSANRKAGLELMSCNILASRDSPAFLTSPFAVLPPMMESRVCLVSHNGDVRSRPDLQQCF